MGLPGVIILLIGVMWGTVFWAHFAESSQKNRVLSGLTKTLASNFQSFQPEVLGIIHISYISVKTHFTGKKTITPSEPKTRYPTGEKKPTRPKRFRSGFSGWVFFPDKKKIPAQRKEFPFSFGCFPVSVFSERLEPKDESYSMYKSMLEVMVAWVWESQASGWAKGEASGNEGGRGVGGWMSHRYFSWSHTNSIFSAQKSLEIPEKCRNITQEAPLRRNSWGVFISLSQCKVNLLAGLGWDLKFAQFSGSKMSSLGSCERVDLQSKCLFGSGSQSSDFLVRVSFAR